MTAPTSDVLRDIPLSWPCPTCGAPALETAHWVHREQAQCRPEQHEGEPHA